ncbi:hypothetical protein NBRC10513_005839 [Rhodotorula toruloides]|uniref:Uncharacterized protein n=1 Tax=Rhodotorula toruloides TaxID=5286 RepID=A0A2T0A2H8_RHOTO|nr:hypothetical protein AAT19DRAFT_9556 [Rhodotorula toruloides]
MSYPFSYARTPASYSRRALAPPPGRRLISYASSPTPSPPPPPRKRPPPVLQTPRNGQRWPKDGWELLMREESEGGRRGREREMGGEMWPEERARAPERILEQPSFTLSPLPPVSYDTPPHMRRRQHSAHASDGPAHPPLRHKKGIVLRGSYREPLPRPPSSLPRRPPTPLRLDPALPPTASFAPPGLMSRPPVYHNGYRGGQYRDEAFVRGEQRGRPSQSAFAGSLGARVSGEQYVGHGRSYGGATGGRRGPQPAFATPRRVDLAPPAPPHAASTSRQFTFGAGSTASFSFSASASRAPHRLDPPSHPRSPLPAFSPIQLQYTPTPSLSPSFPSPHDPRTASPTDLPPSPPLTLPSRLASPSLDPGPPWLTEALYGPSHEEMCAWRDQQGKKRGRERMEEGMGEEEGEGRGLSGGWDWESWEREKGRKRQRRA